MWQTLVVAVAALTFGIGSAFANCPTPLAPILSARTGSLYSFGYEWNGSTSAWSGPRQYRYKLVDVDRWSSPITISEATKFRSVGSNPEVTADHPGLVEVQVRGNCGVNGWSAWSLSSQVNINETPYFADSKHGRPLPDDAKVCVFVEGNTQAGKNNAGCRILGRDPDTVSRQTLKLTVEGDHADVFTTGPGPRYDNDRTFTDGSDTTGEWYAHEERDHATIDSVHTLRFASPANFEDTLELQDGVYTITLALVDQFGFKATGDWTIRVLDRDEPETWTLNPTTPRVGETVVATVTGGDHLQDLDFLWESSADVTPHQWRRIPDAAQASHAPGSADAGQWLRVIARYTDVGGAKEEVLVAAAVIAANTPPSFTTVPPLTRTFAENPLPNTPVGDPIVATDTTGDVLVYSLGGTDMRFFAIDAATGQLRTVAGVDYDFNAQPTKTSFEVTVTATDQAGEAGTATVSIILTAVEEDGTITGLTTARVGQELTPTLNDDGSTPTNQRWQWQSSASADGPWKNLSHGQFKDYVPRTAGQYLRVRVTYDSPENTMLREYAEWITTTPVAAAASGSTLTAPEHRSFTFPENQPGSSGTPALVGTLPISATGGTLALEIVEPASSKFTVMNDGSLHYVGGVEDYENLDSPVYPLRIQATAGNLVAYTAVTVTIENVEETGVVTIAAPTTLRPGLPFVATLRDGDAPLDDVQWQWQERADEDTGWRSIAGATYRSFVPWLGQSLIPNNRLRVMVSYVDGQSEGTRRVVTSDQTEVLQAATGTTLRSNQPYLRVRLPERVSAYDSQREKIYLHSFAPLPNAETCDDVGCTELATSNPTDAETTFRIIDGNESQQFHVDGNGYLYYVGYGEDYEVLAAPSEPQYRLRVEVARGEERFHSVVQVYIANEDDPGSLRIDPASPVVGTTLTATVTDPDAGENELRNLSWLWGYVETTPAAGEVLHTIAGATSASYVPTAQDATDARQLVVVATYNDPQGTALRRVEARAAGAVAVASAVNQPPRFKVNPTAIPITDPLAPASAHYIVPDDKLMENASGVQAPIELLSAGTLAAEEPNMGDTVTYSLAAGTPAGFAIDPTSGELTYEGPGVDFEQRSSYMLTVIASDQHGGAHSDDFASVYVPVTDVNEPGTVTLTTTAADGRAPLLPRVGTPTIASLQDEDAVYTFGGPVHATGAPDVTWQWQRSADGGPDGWADIAEATASTYTPTADDADGYLRARARYYDAPNWNPNDLVASRQEVFSESTPPVVGPPAVSDVYFNSDPSNAEYYQPGEVISVTVEFTPAITTSPTCPPPPGTTHQCPTLALEIGEDKRTATLVAIDTLGVAGTPAPQTFSSLDFEYEVTAADADRLGISIPADGLDAEEVQILALADGTMAAVLDLAEFAIEDDDEHPVGENLRPQFDTPTVTYRWPAGRGHPFEVTLPQATGGDVPISYRLATLQPVWISMSGISGPRITVRAPLQSVSGTALIQARDVDGDVAHMTLEYTILDGAVALSVDQSAIDEGAGGQDIVVTATLVRHAGRLDSAAVTVTLAFAGTATADDDYTPSGTETIRIDPGNTTGTTTITFTPTDDASTEGPETIVLNGTAGIATGAYSPIIDVSPATLTITDDDPTAVTIAATDTNVAEGESATFMATFVEAVGRVVIGWGADADLTGTSFTIPAGTITASNLVAPFTVPAADDALAEGAETVDVTFTVGDLATVPGANQTITIAPSDPITIAVTGPSTHAEGATLNYTATLGGGTRTAAVTLTIAMGPGGTAQAADVMLPTPTTVAAHEPAATFAVTIVDDGEDTAEEGETVVLTVSGTDAGGATVTPGSTSPITISQVPLVSIAADVATVAEASGSGGNGSATFTLSLSGAVDEAVTVTWTVQHGASNGTADADFGGTAPTGTVTFAANNTDNQTITVPITNDKLAEADEGFSVALSAPTTPPFGTKVAVSGTPARVTINANDPIQVAIRQNEVALEGAEAEYEVYITNDTVPTADLTATIVVEPTEGANGATIADDLGDLPENVTVAAGATSATFTIPVADDRATVGADAGEAFRVRLSSVSGGGNDVTAPTIAAGQGVVTSTITELPAVSIAPPTPATLIEATAGEVMFTVSADAEITTAIKLAWEIQHGTTAVADFTGSVSGTVTLAAGGSTSTPQTVTIPVTIANDTLAEGVETFAVVISLHTDSVALAGVEVVLDGDTAAATIGASDPIELALAGPTESREGAESMYTVRVSNGVTPTAAVTVAIAYAYGDGAAMDDLGTDADGNAAAPPATATIMAGQTEGEFEVWVTQDDVADADETFTVTISNPMGGGNDVTAPTITAGQAAITTTITEPPAVSIAPPTPAMLAEATAGEVMFTVSADAEIATAIKLAWEIQHGTTAAADFTGAASGTITLAAGGSTSAPQTVTIPITIADDMLAEGAETFSVVIDFHTDSAALSGVEVVIDGATAAATIGASDPIELALAGPTESREGRESMYTVRVSNGVTPTTAVTVDVAYAYGDGAVMADLGTDADGRAAAPPATATIAAGQTASEFGVWVTRDDVVDADETFTVTIGNPMGGGNDVTAPTIAAGQGAITSTITEPLPVISLAPPTPATLIEETAGEVMFTVRLDDVVDTEVELNWEIIPAETGGTVPADFGGEVTTGTVTLAAGGAPVPQTVSIPVTIADDMLAEGAESFSVVIDFHANSVALDGVEVAIDGDTAAAVIAASDPIALAIRQTAPAREGGMAAYEVYVTNGTIPTTDITVTIVVEPTGGENDATIAADLGTLPTLATIVAGATSTTFTIPVEDDGADAGETFRVRIGSASGGGNDVTAPAIAPGMGAVTSTITELPAVWITAPTPAFVEEDAGTLTFVVSLDNAVDEAVMVDWVVAHETTAPADFGTPTSGTVTFPANSTADQMIAVTIDNDDFAEVAESFSIAISFHAASAALDGHKVVILWARATATINANDNPMRPGIPVDLSAQASHNHVTLTWSPPTTGPLALAIAGYRLQVATAGNGGGWQDLLQPAEGLRTTFTHQPLAVNQELRYRIAASNALGDGAFSSTVTATTLDYALGFDRFEQVTSEDTLALVYSLHVLDTALSDSPTDVALRRTFLGALAEEKSEDDAVLREQLELGQDMKQYGGNSRLDVTDDETLNAADAIIIYYALTFPELVGDGGGSPGFEHVRRILLGRLFGMKPTDAQLVEMVRRASQLRGD